MNLDKKMSVDDAKFRIQEKAKLTDDEWEAAKGDTEETADNGNG